MEEFYTQAMKKLREAKPLNNQKAKVMAPAVRQALEHFC